MPRIDQLCYYAANEEAEASIKRNLNLQDARWVEDIATSMTIYNVGTPQEHRIQTKSRLQYNYDLGIELEILTFLEGVHWLFLNSFEDPAVLSKPLFSHVGVHLLSNEEFPVLDWPIVMESLTLSHTSEYLTKEGSPGFGRKYHFKIYKISEGNFIKYIYRVQPPNQPVAAQLPLTGEATFTNSNVVIVGNDQ